MYFIQKRRCEISLQKWIIASTISLITAPLLVIFIFYSYTGALGIESVLLDIALVFICYFIAIKLALNIYKHVHPSTSKTVFSILVIALFFLSFIIFTFSPPHLPIFSATESS